MNRIIDCIEGDSNEVLMIVIGGIHGNEHSGVKAIQNLFRFIREDKIKIRGKFVGLAGNLQALKENKRFIKYDLNRCWTEEHIASVKSTPEGERSFEDIELIDLFDTINEILEEGEFQRTYIIDLHATSSDHGNFIVHAGSVHSNHILESLKLPVIVNLDDYVRGTLLKFYNKNNHTVFVFEGGQIGAAKTIEVHTYGMWEMMNETELIPEQHDIGKMLHYEELIQSVHNHKYEQLRVLYRHPVKREDYFRMKPGFTSFQEVEKGELLAEDKKGKIKAPVHGKLFMPLYQNVGEDGFFIVENI